MTALVAISRAVAGRFLVLLHGAHREHPLRERMRDGSVLVADATGHGWLPAAQVAPAVAIASSLV